MSKGENQKLKMLYLVKIFTEYTDDQHSLTMQEIIKKLESYDISADRKTLYLDFAELECFGLDIIREKIGRNTYYHLGKRQFELPELKLLVDSVQAAKFITDKKSKALIKKLENLVSMHEARQLQRQVVISGRVKTPNKLVYNNVDTIYSAIADSQQISFHYFQWDLKGNPVLRHNGALYQVSPWCLMWDDEYYYLVAYDAEADRIKHYRVDKMKDLSVVDAMREGQETFKSFNMAKYSKIVFGMFGGEETCITLECSNDKAGIIIDRFGKDITLIPIDENHFYVHVNVIPSSQFLGWIMSLGDGIKITGPSKVVHQMQNEVRRLAEQYLKC
nr:WYL domain-containing protein [Shuttleworthia satelles]